MKQQNFSGMAPADYKKGQLVKVIKTGYTSKIEMIYPTSGGYFYVLEDGKMYLREEIEKVKV